RFDGVRFVTFTTNNIPDLGDNRITSLLVSRTGVLWVATESGLLARQRTGTFERVTLPPGLRGGRITALAEDREGGLWVATRATGLGCRHPANTTSSGGAESEAVDWEVFSQKEGLPANGAAQVVADVEGRMWALSGGRLVTLDQGRWQVAQE